MDRCTGPADIATRFQDAWNTHDMQALGALFHAGATFVNRFANYWRGVDEIVAAHAAIHASIYRDSTLAVEAPDIDQIAEDAAILHFWCRLSVGDAHSAGPHQIDTMTLAVVTRRDGEWRFQAVENATLVNPMTGEAFLRTDPQTCSWPIPGQ